VKSVRSLPLVQQMGLPLSLRAVAGAARIAAPVSVRDLLQSLSFRTWRATITTPDPEALSGNVQLTIWGNGRYELLVHMHDSGLPDYSFRLGVLLRAASGMAVLALYSRGVVHGTASTGSRDSDERQAGQLAALQANWDDFVAGDFTVQREYQNDLIGWIESALLDVATFLVGCVTVGGPAACVILGASLLSDHADVQLPGELGLAGLILAEGAYFVCGPGVFIPVFIAGALVSAALFKRRRLHPHEIAAARTVFGETVPYDRIWITNLEYVSGRAFAALGIDGNIMIGLGSRFDDAVADQMRRRTFIHEMTHVWQIVHTPTLSALCTGTINRGREASEGQDGLYDVDTLTLPWDAYNWEQQAVIIATADWLRQEFSRQGVPYEAYDTYPTEQFIREHILMG
jgi:hypothetical protein